MAKKSPVSYSWSVVAVVSVVVLAPTPVGAAPGAPRFQVPFPCDEMWTGSTYEEHSPVEAVDFNRPDDLGDAVLAAAPGTVSRAEDDGPTSYGLWIEIDHGHGWTTRYGHLSALKVGVGDPVRQAQYIGDVGGTGNVTGPHLHFEQRSAGKTVKIEFDGAPILYWGKKEYTSRNGC